MLQKKISRGFILMSVGIVTALALISVILPAYANDMNSKLKALESAYQSGILTETEYRDKKAEIMKSAQTDNTAKLEALESAFRSGILTEAEYRRKKAELTGTAQSKPQQEKINLSPTKQAGTIFRHPTGVSFWYPSNWRTQALSGVLQLVPPGAANTADKYETYYITGENVANDGIRDPNHPAVMPYLEEQMQLLGQELGVYFQRTSDAKPVSTSQGNGIRVDWSAESRIGPVKARVYVTIIRDYGLSLTCVGVKDLLERRESEILRIFSSFGVGEGKLDPQLVGTWNLTSTYAIQNNSVWETDYSRAKMVSEKTSTLTFNPDGSWIRQDKSHMLVGAGSVWLEDKSQSTKRGRWNADGSSLFMLWEDESFEDYRYRLQGNELRMAAGNKGQLWTRAR